MSEGFALASPAAGRRRRARTGVVAVHHVGADEAADGGEEPGFVERLDCAVCEGSFRLRIVAGDSTTAHERATGARPPRWWCPRFGGAHGL